MIFAIFLEFRRMIHIDSLIFLRSRKHYIQVCEHKNQYWVLMGDKKKGEWDNDSWQTATSHVSLHVGVPRGQHMHRNELWLSRQPGHHLEVSFTVTALEMSREFQTLPAVSEHSQNGTKSILQCYKTDERTLVFKKKKVRCRPLTWKQTMEISSFFQ